MNAKGISKGDPHEEKIVTEGRRALRGEGKRGGVPPLWDGQAAERLADVLLASAAR